MARNECTPEQLDDIAAELAKASEILRTIANEMRSVEMPHMLLHSSMYMNVHLPATTEFAMKTQIESINQIRAHSAGIASRAETRKKYHANQKLAGAKKKTPKIRKAQD